MSFDARHPDFTGPTFDRKPNPVGMAPTRLPPEVLAKVGETFAVALCALQRSLATLGPVAPEQQLALDAGLAEISRLEQLGLQIQEFARVLGGRVPMTPERLDLARAARAALAEWTGAARRKGVELAGPREPFELDVNAGVLEQLLDLGLEYALNIGSRVEVTAGVEGLPAHASLSIQVERSPLAPDADTSDDFNELHWLLFVQLARAMGLSSQRIAVGKTVRLTLGFPGDGADDAAISPASAAELPRTAVAAGRHVLLVETQDIARVHAHRLMRDVGMRVDAVATLDQARASLRDGPPDVIVTGVPVDDPACHALVEDVRNAQPRLRVIELVDDDNAFAFSVPGSDCAARVGRHDMARTLVPALSQELDAAWPA